ncbi:hypothetical protein [Mycobacterium sp. Lab-001]|uniref:hypothetical protein n=1 Tax=Mycobacterium sp. Lab-001 TaxID=3410136 RepID=UPI003D16779E
MKKLRKLSGVLFRRNFWRAMLFDVIAPAAIIAALAAIGIMLRWPAWWAAACSALTLLVVASVVANVVWRRRYSVTIGTGDAHPWIRLIVATVMTGAIAAMVAVGYFRVMSPIRDIDQDSSTVARIAASMAQASSSFSPLDPTASLNRATALMAPDRVGAFKQRYSKATAAMAKNMVTADVELVAAGVEGISQSAARVAVLMRGTQSRPDIVARHTVIALQVLLAKEKGRWLVLDVLPIHR